MSHTDTAASEPKSTTQEKEGSRTSFVFKSSRYAPSLASPPSSNMPSIRSKLPHLTEEQLAKHRNGAQAINARLGFVTLPPAATPPAIGEDGSPFTGPWPGKTRSMTIDSVSSRSPGPSSQLSSNAPSPPPSRSPSRPPSQMQRSGRDKKAPRRPETPSLSLTEVMNPVPRRQPSPTDPLGELESKLPGDEKPGTSEGVHEMDLQKPQTFAPSPSSEGSPEDMC